MSGPVDIAAWLLSYLPGFITDWGALAAPLLGLAAAVWLRAQMGVAGKWPALLASAVGLLVGAMLLGISAQRSVCEAVKAREEIARLKATIADRESRLAEYQLVTMMTANREAQAQADLEALSLRKNSYDAAVATARQADPSGACRFDQPRIDRLRALAGTGARPAVRK